MNSFKRKYYDDIQDVYQSCELNSGKEFDFVLLNSKIENLCEKAVSQGIEAFDFETWVQETIPDVYEDINLFKKAAAA
jgi:hypothetical protein